MLADLRGVPHSLRATIPDDFQRLGDILQFAVSNTFCIQLHDVCLFLVASTSRIACAEEVNCHLDDFFSRERSQVFAIPLRPQPVPKVSNMVRNKC